MTQKGTVLLLSVIVQAASGSAPMSAGEGSPSQKSKECTASSFVQKAITVDQLSEKFRESNDEDGAENEREPEIGDEGEGTTVSTTCPPGGPTTEAVTVTAPSCERCSCPMSDETYAIEMGCGSQCHWRHFNVHFASEYSAEHSHCERKNYEVKSEPAGCATSPDLYQTLKVNGKTGLCVEISRKCKEEYSFFPFPGYSTVCEDEETPQELAGKRLKYLHNSVVEDICRAACATDSKCVGYYVNKTKHVGSEDKSAGASCIIFGERLASIVPGFASTDGKATVINGTQTTWSDPDDSDLEYCKIKVGDPRATTITTTQACSTTEWSNWESCSVSCGPHGVEKRFRTTEPVGCDETEDERPCADQEDCPKDCVPGDWMEWGDCSQKCHGGIRKRIREVLEQAENGGKRCDDVQEKPCGAPPKDCQLSNWTAWGKCSKSCDSGFQHRSRSIVTHAECGGAECRCDLLHSMRNCFHAPCERECEVGDWAEWGVCTATCGGGTRTRTRNLTKVPSGGGKSCPAMMESKNCGMQHCPQNCVHGEWTEWSNCTKSCYGTQERKRSLLVLPSNGGQKCEDLIETTTCRNNCKQDCAVGDWTPWSSCTKACGGGSSTRSRAVVARAANGGAQCPALVEAKACHCVQCGRASAKQTQTFPETGSFEFEQLKMACDGVAEDGEHLRQIFMEQSEPSIRDAGTRLHATIEWCLERAGPDGFPSDGSPHLQQLKKECKTTDINALKHLFAGAGSLEGALSQCREHGGIVSEEEPITSDDQPKALQNENSAESDNEVSEPDYEHDTSVALLTHTLLSKHHPTIADACSTCKKYHPNGACHAGKCPDGSGEYCWCPDDSCPGFAACPEGSSR